MTAAERGSGSGSRSVLLRALGLLAAFRPGDTELTLTELAARASLPKATAHRMLADLTTWGALERRPGGYRIGSRLFELGQLAPMHQALRAVALPFLQELFDATQENVHLAVPQDTSTLFVEKLVGHRSMSITSRVGGRLPAYCTATGKVFLAFGRPEVFSAVLAGGLARLTPRTIVAPRLLERDIARTKDCGVGMNWEECEVGVTALAVPVFDVRRQLVGSVSVTGRLNRLPARRLTAMLGSAADGIRQQLARGPD